MSKEKPTGPACYLNSGSKDRGASDVRVVPFQDRFVIERSDPDALGGSSWRMILAIERACDYEELERYTPPDPETFIIQALLKHMLPL